MNHDRIVCVSICSKSGSNPSVISLLRICQIQRRFPFSISEKKRSVGGMSTSSSANHRSRLIGWRSKTDRNKFLFALVGSIACYVGVLYSEVQENQRRHSSIQKDIERERWRAQQLGIEGQTSDDGFAHAYLHQLKESGEYERNIKKYGSGLILPTKANDGGAAR